MHLIYLQLVKLIFFGVISSILITVFTCFDSQFLSDMRKNSFLAYLEREKGKMYHCIIVSCVFTLNSQFVRQNVSFKELKAMTTMYNDLPHTHNNPTCHMP